ncbi:MAG: cobalt-precorrin-5B (C(1))-methyltransferase [Cellvibrionaceae bacterium]|nr:cobalt-precorrin-5B (C(1))-methyltransferase [Cellvibrionaceae bacterium]
MWPESSETQAGGQPAPLRTGLTTGACATACCVAAATQALGKHAPKHVSIRLPVRKMASGKQVDLTIENCQQHGDRVRASTIKDAGDDPDITHGASVFVELQLTASPGIAFGAAAGVGTVTREGLPVAVGEAAINPVPRQMMVEHLEALARYYNYGGGFNVAVGIENGETLALKTMNPRLGIVGGLSILGTTGIVRPFSCAAWIASIYQGIDVAEANGCSHIAAATGNRSEQAVKAHYSLQDIALIDMGDFVGAVLKHLKKISADTDSAAGLQIKKLSLCGGFGKISKLAQGNMDLHSRACAIDFHYLADVAKDLGAGQALCQKIRQANTSIEALHHCQTDNIDLAGALCTQALAVARKIVPSTIEVELMAIDREGKLVGRAGS